MTDGADYPGYPEPKPEEPEEEDSEIKRGAIFLWNRFIKSLEALAEAVKMMTAAFIGAFVAVQISAVLTGGPQIQGLLPFYIVFTAIYMVMYWMKRGLQDPRLYF